MSIKLANELCEEKGHQLLYLCKFGSHLYGLNTPESDIDYKGIFLPNKESMLLGQKCRSLHYSSGNDNGKNSKDDVDIDLFSLQYFLELASKGETNALDLLFSISNQEVLEYLDEGLLPIFQNPLRIVNPVSANAYIGYCIGQSKRYGISASRLGVIKDIYNYLNTLDINDEKLRFIGNDILNKFHHDSYCFHKIINNEDALVICGRVHLFNIKLSEFYNRIKREFDKYGERVKQAHKNENVDFKALSHAVRSMKQMEQLLTTGTIIFPFTREDKQELLDIKQGKLPYLEIEKIILKGLNKIEELKENNDVVTGKTDNKFINNTILSFYN